MKDSRIILEGKRKKKIVCDSDVYLLQQRLNGPFRRVIEVPVDCDVSTIAARLEDGLLVLTMQRVINPDVKTIAINSLVSLQTYSWYTRFTSSHVPGSSLEYPKSTRYPPSDTVHLQSTESLNPTSQMTFGIHLFNFLERLLCSQPRTLGWILFN